MENDMISSTSGKRNGINPHDHGKKLCLFSSSVVYSIARHLNGSTEVTVVTAPIDKSILQGMVLYVGEVIHQVP